MSRQFLSALTAAAVLTGVAGVAAAQGRELSVSTDTISSSSGVGNTFRIGLTVPTDARESRTYFVGTHEGSDSSDTRVVYGVETRRLLVEDRGWWPKPFLTVGFLGTIEYVSDWDCHGRPDCSGPQWGPYIPSPLFQFVLGGGLKVPLAPGLNVRVEAQQQLLFLVIPNGFRIAASLSVPIGPRSAARRR